MALKMKENYQKTATAAAKQQAASPANVYLNRAGTAVTLTNEPITMNNRQKNQGKLPKDCEAVESIKGRFSWETIGEHRVPYIIRVINGEELKFVSARMAETQLLNIYLGYLHADIYTSCTNVRSLLITKPEAKLLNDINEKHADCMYGKKDFLAGNDCIVSLEDVREFYTFIEVCYKKIMCDITPGHREKCGFIRINSVSVVPYCIKDNQKYVPLFYFEGVSENLRQQSLKLENWDLAYLKFGFKVHGIIKELFASDSCAVASLDEIKNIFPPETNFEEYYPAKVFYSQLLTIQKSKRVNPPGVWIRAPPKVVPAKNTVAHTLTAPAPARPANQIGSTMSQGSSLVNSVVNVVPPPPLVCASNTTLIIGNTISNSNVVPISQMRQTQQSYSGQSVHDRLTNTQQRKALRNAAPVAIAPPSEIIDLTSPSSSSIPPTVQENSLRPIIRWQMMGIPERMGREHGTLNNVAYKIQKSTLQGRAIHCINAKPYIHNKDLLVTLKDFVQMVLPSCTVEKCAFVLNKYLKTTIFSGNSEQLAVLKRNGRIRQIYPAAATPMARLHDVTRALPQFKAFVSKLDKQREQYQAGAAGGPAKRRRTR
ncbi:unnamed protein product [Macrosiphum euphorbiae]|uniref:Uncharacterized protein n=2 Tax=Macrosiphum euphorbiae TaxID=13131 RepID=A0AAV0WTX7_9HEMI|nr:unnamed protein product [Macrosiphum euphorbiae]